MNRCIFTPATFDEGGRNHEGVAISTNTGWWSGLRAGIAVAGWVAVVSYVIGETHDIPRS